MEVPLYVVVQGAPDVVGIIVKPGVRPALAGGWITFKLSVLMITMCLITKSDTRRDDTNLNGQPA